MSASLHVHTTKVCVLLLSVLNTEVHVVPGLLKITGLSGLLEFLGIGAV